MGVEWNGGRGQGLSICCGAVEQGDATRRESGRLVSD